MTATVISGNVLQAGVVHGGVHLHHPPPPDVLPRQLPAAPPCFTGRTDALAALDAVFTPPGTGSSSRTTDATPGGTTVVISAIGGTGGIGKTWLALHWAHHHLDHFPDGQLFADLHGFSPDHEPTPPAVAVRGFLDALGIEPSRIPTGLDAQAALFRSLVAGRRMLVVLDNAATTAHVTPLLPGGNRCAVLVTSRNQLPGLITRHGAHPLHLDVLDRAEARALLVRRVGAARVSAEPDAAADLVESCQGFPLALGILAGRAQCQSRLPLADLAAELRRSGVQALNDDDPAASLPAVLSTSRRALTDAQHRAFALLGIAPGPDTSLAAAAALTGLPPAQAEHLLRGLQEASLLEQHTRNRYSMHDLVRDYAATTVHQHLTKQTKEEALTRTVDFYLHTAHAADRLLNPHAHHIRLGPPAPDAQPLPMPDDTTALNWLDTEHRHLLAVQRLAATSHQHDVVWQLAWTLTAFHYRRGHRHDELATWRTALDSAPHLPDRTTRARIHRGTGAAHAGLGQHEQAIEHLYRSLGLLSHHHDPTDQAPTHQQLANAWARRGHHHRALEHATQALELYRKLDQPVREAHALNQVGWYTARLGDHDTARTHCQLALTLHRRHHYPTGEATALDHLAWIDHHTGHHDRAVDHYEQALALFRALGNTFEAANTLDRLGHPHVALGHRDRARTAWREAQELYRQQGRDTEAEEVARRLDALD
ncbi:ATP-binding protein [Saccharothrix syringae]|uniref:ATP-binding protein n=1 Tax=Saccharothrix syringae TaxID=103733 RepID=UPI000A03A453|nr:tetratricopeptide repeat protein [Saccharothrix syringae]